MRLFAQDTESLRQGLLLATYPTFFESRGRLARAGWLKEEETEWLCNPTRLRVRVSNGQMAVEETGGSRNEAWFRVALKALQENQPMTPTIHTDPPPIRPDESGTLRVGDSRVVLEVLVREYEEGADPESIAHAYPTLGVADVYAAIAYYLRHKAELDEYLRWRKEGAAKLRQEIESQQPGTPGLREKLESRRAQQEKGRASSGS